MSSARLIAEKLKDRVGQNVIVESRAGAGGATGTGYVAQQPGNGCTILLAYDTHAVNPVLLNLPFDTLTAFKPIVMIGTIPNIIAAHPSQPYKTFAEMVTEAKKEPDRLAYATGGTGTVGASFDETDRAALRHAASQRAVPRRRTGGGRCGRGPRADDGRFGAGAGQFRQGE